MTEHSVFFVHDQANHAGRLEYQVAPVFFALDLRFMKYARRERKNGRVPFIDPFATNSCRQVYGE